MKAALMWTIIDFPAYAILSGWSTAGHMACPYCMDDSDAFTLQKSGKQSWFDNHRKFLLATYPYRHNLTTFKKNKLPNKLQNNLSILVERSSVRFVFKPKALENLLNQ